MAHKKYIKRNGKVFGPYYYENYRVGDKVKTRYIGTKPPSRATELTGAWKGGARQEAASHDSVSVLYCRG